MLTVIDFQPTVVTKVIINSFQTFLTQEPRIYQYHIVPESLEALSIHVKHRLHVHTFITNSNIVLFILYIYIYIIYIIIYIMYWYYYYVINDNVIKTMMWSQVDDQIHTASVT